MSGTTRVSRYQKGKTDLDFTEARDSEWQWHQLGHMQVCTALQTDNHASAPPLKFFTGRMPFLLPNQQRQSTEDQVLKAIVNKFIYIQVVTVPMKLDFFVKLDCTCLRLPSFMGLFCSFSAPVFFFKSRFSHYYRQAGKCYGCANFEVSVFSRWEDVIGGYSFLECCSRCRFQPYDCVFIRFVE